MLLRMLLNQDQLIESGFPFIFSAASGNMLNKYTNQVSNIPVYLTAHTVYDVGDRTTPIILNHSRLCSEDHKFCILIIV